MNALVRFCLENKLVVILLLGLGILWGLITAPFDWDLGSLPRDPVPVDAIPDIGENQQIVFTEWMGRSPQDVEDQITYPLTVSLLGVPGVRTVRSQSFFGFSSIYVLFKDDVDFYGSRSRILEKLNSLASGTLPSGVQPRLGPDATALGQVYWYTLEGRDETGQPTGGWDLDELRTIQDWYVRYALLSAEGVSEVASVGGFVREYQVDVDPDSMRAHDVKLEDVFQAIRMSNLDVGARSIEVNKVEYFIRGLGFIKTVEDIEKTVVKVTENVPITMKDIASINLGPALRRGALDKGGAEAVGGVVVVRHGENPLAAIQNVKAKIQEITEGLPDKVVIDFSQTTRSDVEAFAKSQGFAAYRDGDLNQEAWVSWVKATPAEKQPEWATYSKVEILPFYDRSGLIYETLGTLSTAIGQEILITIIVVLLMVRHLPSSVLISGLLPMAVLMTFIAMRYIGVDANIVALSGIAIAIGTMVDMGIVICENILRRLREGAGEDRLSVICSATVEVGSAVLTAVATTIVGFLPVFAMEGAEGKLFQPLAYTKTFALIASVVIALTLIPALAHLLFREKPGWLQLRWRICRRAPAGIGTFLLIGFVVILLARSWLPFGPEKGLLLNTCFVGAILILVLTVVTLFKNLYARLLRHALDHKAAFLSMPGVLIVLGLLAWGNLGKEFMPPLDEGAYLLMPTTMPHASIGEALDVLSKQDMATQAIPEIDSVVGKLGRVESPLDPAPISMFENVINYKPEFLVDRDGHRLRFRFNPRKVDWFRDVAGHPLPADDGEPYRVRGTFERDEQGELIQDGRGVPFRLWRPALDPDLNENRSAWVGIQRPDDIWDHILRATEVPGTTSAPRLQPIAARLVMLQSGMRAPMGVKVKGPDLKTLEAVGLELERFLREVPGVQPSAVIAERMVGKPYLEIEIDRDAIARYGLHIQEVQDVIEVAIGGKTLTTTVEGRERYPVRVRYLRELRDQIESLSTILVPAPGGAQIPLSQLAEIRYLRGPQAIKSEDTFLVGYVTFDKKPGYAEVDVVEACRAFLQDKLDSGEFDLPAGVSYVFAGNYENQIRASQKLAVLVPVALFIIFLILYLQFRSTGTALMVFAGILVAWSGGFLLLWCYGQDWFFNISLWGVNLRDLFQVHPINLSVAVWVGFLALFGIASDDGVLMATILRQRLASDPASTRDAIRTAVVEGAERRIRPALMTSATTILALLPVLTSTGRGADIMIPMAIPCFGGMIVALITVFVVPVLYCAREERRRRYVSSDGEKALL